MSDNTGSNNSTRRISKVSIDHPNLPLKSKSHSKSVAWKKQNNEPSPTSDKKISKIINDLGNVTPKPLSLLPKIEEDGSTSKYLNEKYSPSNDSMLFRNISIHSVDNRTIETPFSRTVFGFGVKQSDSIFASTDIEENYTLIDDKILDFHDNRMHAKTKNENFEEIVEIEISETDTIIIFETPSVSVFADSPEADKIRQLHEISKEIMEEKATGKFKSSSNLTLTKDNSDRFTEHSFNTSNYDLKNKTSQTMKIMTSEFSSNVNTYDLFNYSTQEEFSNLENIEVKDNMEKYNPNVEVENTINEKSEVDILLDEKLFKNHLNNLTKNANFKKILQSMERSINMNNYKKQLSIYRGYNRDLVTEKGTSPNIGKLWTFQCPLTHGKKVNCITWNKKNDDIMAVGYECPFLKTGLICCWSIKNLEYPEKVYKCPTSVLSLDFSNSQPNLLAASCSNGTILLYNVFLDEMTPIFDNFESTSKHSALAWKVKWVERFNESTQMKDTEILISISSDGRVSEWSIHKGFECHDLMKMKRVTHNAKHEIKITEGQISKITGGLCIDFNIENPSVYLIGTEDGSIHKCSCAYKEQYIKTYCSHSSPVYDVAWSPFLSDVFLSCSADWSIKVWQDEKEQPILNLHSSTKSISSICWSPVISTAFACVSENNLEVWDLRENNLDPILKFPPITTDSKLTQFMFTRNGECIVTGDSSGNIHVCQLKGMTSSNLNQAFELQRIIDTA